MEGKPEKSRDNWLDVGAEKDKMINATSRSVSTVASPSRGRKKKRKKGGKELDFGDSRFATR